MLTQLQEAGGNLSKEGVQNLLAGFLGYAPRIVHSDVRKLADVAMEIEEVAEACGVRS